MFACVIFVCSVCSFTVSCMMYILYKYLYNIRMVLLDVRKLSDLLLPELPGFSYSCANTLSLLQVA